MSTTDGNAPIGACGCTYNNPACPNGYRLFSQALIARDAADVHSLAGQAAIRAFEVSVNTVDTWMAHYWAPNALPWAPTTAAANPPADSAGDSEDQRSHLRWLIERYGYARREGEWDGQPSAVWIKKALQAADRLVIDEFQEQIDTAPFHDSIDMNRLRARIATIEGWIENA